MQQIELTKIKEEETRRGFKIERQKRIGESKKASKTYGTFYLSTPKGKENCKVTDAGVTCQRDGNNEKQSYSIMFVDIRDIRRNSYPGPAPIQYYAIEIGKRETRMASEKGDAHQDSMNTSWRNIAQWISENRNDIDKFFDVLSNAHREWRTKFSDIAE